MTAKVIPPDRPTAPPRRPCNGHHADCPYPKTDAATCSVCASMRKGSSEVDRPAAQPPTTTTEESP